MRRFIGVSLGLLILAGAIVVLGFGYKRLGLDPLLTGVAVLGLAVIAFLLIRAVWRRRAAIGNVLSYPFRNAHEVCFRAGQAVGVFWGTNNRRAVFMLVWFVLVTGWTGYQFYRSVDSYLETPLVQKLSASDPAELRSETGKAVYQYWDNNQPRPVTHVATPHPERSLKSVGWFIRQTALMFMLGVFTLIYFPLSWREELRRVFRRFWNKVHQSSGVYLEADRPNLIRQWWEKTFGQKPAPTVVAAAVTPTAVTPTVTAAPAVPTTVPAAEKPGLFKKYGHWLAIAGLFLEELIEAGPIFLRRRKS